MEENCRKKWVSSPKKRFYWLSEVFTIYHLILMTLYIIVINIIINIYNISYNNHQSATIMRRH